MSPAVANAPAMARDELALACVHCGLCLGACPTYLETGNENESPRGRVYLMRAIESGRLSLNPTTVRHLDLCLGCRACETACPSGVEYGQLIEGARERIEREVSRRWTERLARALIHQVVPYPRRMRALLWPARLLRRLGVDRMLPGLAGRLVGLLPERLEPAPPLREVYRPRRTPRRGAVGLLRGCATDVLFRRTHVVTIRLLQRAGYEVVVPPGQVCCGALHAHSGLMEKARELARRNLAAFKERGVQAVVVNAAGCGSTLKEYGRLLANDPAWAEEAQTFAASVFDLSELLVRSLDEDPDRLKFRPWRDEGRVTFHDACHLAHAQGITQAPRRLVRLVAGEAFIELPEADLCCGSAGSYNLLEPEMAARLKRRKTANILATGALTVVTTNPGCQLQIEAGLRGAGARQVRVVHLADFLEEHLV